MNRVSKTNAFGISGKIPAFPGGLLRDFGTCSPFVIVSTRRCGSTRLDCLECLTHLPSTGCVDHRPPGPLAESHAHKLHSVPRKDDVMVALSFPGKDHLGGCLRPHGVNSVMQQSMMLPYSLWWLILCANLAGHGMSKLNTISGCICEGVSGWDEHLNWWLSKIEDLPQCGWASSNPVEGTNGTKGRILPLFPNSLLETIHFFN